MLWFVVWLFLSWPPSAQYAITGIFVSILVTFITSDIFSSPYSRRDEAPGHGMNIFGLFSRIFWFFCYAIIFLWGCVIANIDVAWRVLHPKLPIRPGTVRIKTSLKSDIGLTFLANSITLTPGTTTVDIDKERGLIYVHRIYIKDGHTLSENLPVVDRFEKILKKVFE